ncbi:MAG: CRTAC1 family protein [Victivallaceae bacterium]|nr:CRTAC1 family protein [Victivallaceae bacterium]
MKILNRLYVALLLPLMCSCVAHQTEFRDVTREAGLGKLGNQKAAWADLNNDGWPDLVSDGRIWKNLDGKTFVEVTRTSGIESISGPGVVADFNGDGIKDIYFIRQGGNLYFGSGDFKFVKGQTFKNTAGNVQAACVMDLNNDGYVDVYIANYEIWKKQLGFRDLILRNNKGILIKQWEAPDEKLMRGRGATSCDFNNDGWMDIYVSNYRLMPNFLWVNRGNWKKSDLAGEYGCAGTERRNVVFKNCLGIPYGSSGHTIGSLWADFNNDTYFDLFVGNFSHPPNYQDRPMMLQNGGPDKNYRFIDRSAIAGIPWQESYGSPAAADVDNDGRVDIFYNTCYPRDSGRLFHNLGNWRFKDITPETAIRAFTSSQNAFADFDNDGRVDLLTSGCLYRNVSDAGNWLEVTLAGKSPNTSAVGAKVIVDCGRQKYIRQVEAGTGAGNQNDLRLHFGLGSYRGIIKADVIWPDGRISHHEFKINTRNLVKEP